MIDENIINELKVGNTKVFESVVDKYKGIVFSIAFKYTNDYNESQDLAQEIFLKIYKNIKSFKGECKFSTWITKISINACLDYKRKNKVKKINLYNDYIDNNDNIQETPEEVIIMSEKQKIIHKLIYELPDIYKNVIIMYHFNEMPYKEICKTLKIPQKTVETRLYRARKILKEKLKNTYGGELSEL